MDTPARRARSNARLLDGPVGRTLTELAAPMVAGLAAVILFSLVDTLYVSRLGGRELAAMSFTFPVVFVVMNITLGLGMGVTAVISRAIGEGDRGRVRRLSTDGLLLGVVVMAVVAAGGLLTMKPLFRAMGADEEMIRLVKAYMVPWYLGVGLLVLPMIGNAAIRSTGDNKTPSFIMVLAGCVNIVLDPLLIFGPGPFPRLELQGAAIATVLSWVSSFGAALWILARRERMIDWARPRAAALWASWKPILYVGVPAAATGVLLPLSNAIFTRMCAMFGPDAVAAFGVGSRVQSFAVIGISALHTAVAPFVGQNFGAGHVGRLGEAVRFCNRAAIAYGLGTAVVLAALSAPVARIFSDEPAVLHGIVQYLLLVPSSYGFYGVALLINSFFNAVNRPVHSTSLILLRLFVFSVPLSYAGARLGGVPGVFVGIALSNAFTGFAAMLMVRRFLSALSLKRPAPSAPATP